MESRRKRRRSCGYGLLSTGIVFTSHLSMKKTWMRNREDGGLRIRCCIEVCRISSVPYPICFHIRDTLMYLNPQTLLSRFRPPERQSQNPSRTLDALLYSHWLSIVYVLKGRLLNNLLVFSQKIDDLTIFIDSLRAEGKKQKIPFLSPEWPCLQR